MHGDSTVTLPRFADRHPELRCDVIFVDGGHSYAVAKSDFLTFRRLATNATVVIADDVEKDDVGMAWNESGLVDLRFIQDTDLDDESRLHSGSLGLGRYDLPY